jgi:hypothetical protein
MATLFATWYILHYLLRVYAIAVDYSAQRLRGYVLQWRTRMSLRLLEYYASRIMNFCEKTTVYLHIVKEAM